MTLHYRRLIYSTFILIFIIVAPILILYSLGYRFDFKKTKFQQTGSLSITTIPRNALVALDGELLSENTPLKIDDLLPTTYLVNITKEGYYPWTKRLEVYPEQVTFIKDLWLFKNNQLPSLLLGGTITDCQLSPDAQHFACIQQFTEQSSLQLFNLTNQQLQSIFTSTGQLAIIDWAPSSKKILLQNIQPNKQEYLVIDIANPNNLININQITSQSLTKLHWDSQSDNRLFGFNQNQLYQIELATQQITPRLVIKAIDYFVHLDQIYYLTSLKNDNDGQLIQQDLDNLNNPQIIIPLLKISQPRFYLGTGDYLILIDSDQQDFFLIHLPLTNNEEVFAAPAKKISWHKNQTTLLYYNDFEIWLYDLPNNKKELITRYGQEIKEVIWHPQSNNLILLKKVAPDKTQLLALELDQRDNFHLIQLAEMAAISNLTIDPKGERIYFVGKIGQQAGFYELVIH